MQTRPNCALGRRESQRDLLEPQVLVVVKGNDVAIPLGQLVESGPNPGVALACGRCRVGWWLDGRVVGGRKAAQVFEVEPLDETGAVPALRAHQHESFVRRHTEEPGGEARVAAERSDAPDDLHQGRLDEIAPVFVRQRVAQQLLLDHRRQPRSGQRTA